MGHLAAEVHASLTPPQCLTVTKQRNHFTKVKVIENVAVACSWLVVLCD